MMQRRFFAEELQAICNIRTPALVEALASVPRENFLRPGPWFIRSEGDFGSTPRQAPDADPRHVYHDVAITIDPARQLFNGAPGIAVVCVGLCRCARAPARRPAHPALDLHDRADGPDNRERCHSADFSHGRPQCVRRPSCYHGGYVFRCRHPRCGPQ